MVNFIDTRYVTPRPAVTTKGRQVNKVETRADETRSRGSSTPAFVERRKVRDRRSRRDKNGRLVYDMRSGRGRRKTDRIPPSIELDV